MKLNYELFDIFGVISKKMIFGVIKIKACMGSRFKKKNNTQLQDTSQVNFGLGIHRQDRNRR